MPSARISSVILGWISTPRTAGLFIKNEIITTATKIAFQRKSALPFPMCLILTLSGLLFSPVYYIFFVVKKILDGSAVINIKYRLIDPIPHRGKRTIPAERAITCGHTGPAVFGAHRFIHKPEHLSHTNFIGRSGQGI